MPGYCAMSCLYLQIRGDVLEQRNCRWHQSRDLGRGWRHLVDFLFLSGFGLGTYRTEEKNLVRFTFLIRSHV